MRAGAYRLHSAQAISPRLRRSSLVADLEYGLMGLDGFSGASLRLDDEDENTMDEVKVVEW